MAWELASSQYTVQYIVLQLQPSSTQGPVLTRDPVVPP
jgi:hypothetical protein